MLTTYFGGPGDNLQLAMDLHTAGVHIDLVRAPYQTVRLGVVNGRNIWLTDFDTSTVPILSSTGQRRA